MPAASVTEPALLTYCFRFWWARSRGGRVAWVGELERRVPLAAARRHREGKGGDARGIAAAVGDAERLERARQRAHDAADAMKGGTP